MRILTLSGVIIGLLAMVACQRELTDEELIFTGDWQSKDYALQIYQNGYGVCNSKRYLITLHYEGRVKITGNRMVFIDKDDPNLMRKRFRIDQRPTIESNGETFMILDGQRFERL